MAFSQGLPADWIVPDWPASDRVGAVFTTRDGGVSAPPFDSFNLGDHVGDDPSAVAANRRGLGSAMAARPVFLKQVHGTRVVQLDEQMPDGEEADACVSTTPGVACTVMVADCLPVLLADRQGRAVAAAHAGWRGLASGVLETSVNALLRVLASTGQAADTGPGDLLAWLGPCIGPDAFEVGEEVRQAFMSADSEAEGAFRPLGQGKHLADLPWLGRRRLQRLGMEVVAGNDGSASWCTVTQSSRFFSHRRDARVLGSTGRMAACVWLR
ncbi:MAG: peptidoglycan editing factor PgeF [Burkholderiales bacterium]|nr:MAG: peptidoglycan editing factor PgeF [Burkholderiales bacterium]